MRIFVDGLIFGKQKSGIGRYAEIIANGLNSYGAKITIAVPHDIHHSFELAPGIEVITTSFVTKSGSLAEHYFNLPSLMNMNLAEVFWGPSHKLPPFRSGTIPQLLTVHDLIWKLFPKTMRPSTLLGERLFSKRSILNADHIIVNSQSTKKDITSHFPVEDRKITIVRPGVSIEGKQVSTIRAASTPFGLCVGTIEPRKNHTTLIEALARSKAVTQDNLSFVIAGHKGWGNLDLNRQITGRRLQEKVKLLLSASDDEVEGMHRDSQMFVLPSLFEGFGFPVLDAMSCRKPIIVSNRGSLKELTDGCAFTVDPTDPQQIADAIDTLFYQPSLRLRLGQKATSTPKAIVGLHHQYI